MLVAIDRGARRDDCRRGCDGRRSRGVPVGGWLNTVVEAGPKVRAVGIDRRVDGLEESEGDELAGIALGGYQRWNMRMTGDKGHGL